MAHGENNDYGGSGDGGGGGGGGDEKSRKENPNATAGTSWKPKIELREQDKWSKRTNKLGKKEWFNQETGKSQKDRPDCLKKYK